jgi:two-component system cell cycle sensor histidine kinase/response regulator CckA
VLVVDDDRQVRHVTVAALRRAGHAVTEAATPGEALALAAGQPFDLVVTDVVMPEMSGPALAAQLRRQCPALRVLFVSGYAGEQIAEAGLSPDDVDLLPKPFDLPELQRRVAAALGRSAA